MSRPRHGEPVNILLVEDNPGDVRLTEEAFEEGRIANMLHVVTDGEAALDFIFQRGEYESAPRPDFVLLDLNLPRVGGMEVLEQIKEDPELRTIPVIILTSSETEEDVVKSYERYTNAYLTKPISPDEFISLVRSFEDFWLSIVTLPEGADR